MVKAWLLLLLLLPLCTDTYAAKYHIECYGEDFFLVRNQLLQCNSKVPQACYTKVNGEKGCTVLQFCNGPNWTCCHEDRCNA